jgi:hypothetical protein
MGKRLIGMKVFLVGKNPVARHVVLSGREIQLPAADEIVQIVFELILYVSVPLG